jgi:hypothetical protein
MTWIPISFQPGILKAFSPDPNPLFSIPRPISRGASPGGASPAFASGVVSNRGTGSAFGGAGVGGGSAVSTASTGSPAVAELPQAQPQPAEQGLLPARDERRCSRYYVAAAALSSLNLSRRSVKCAHGDGGRKLDCWTWWRFRRRSFHGGEHGRISRADIACRPKVANCKHSAAG